MVEFADKIICVREDHGVVDSGEEDEAKNTIVCIDPVTEEQCVLVSVVLILVLLSFWKVKLS